MRKKRDPLLDPQPRWRQRRAALVAWWRRSRNQRQQGLKNLKKTARRALTLAISVVGATLVGYGVWMIYAPAGFIVGGAALWILQWNYGDREGEG